MDTDQLLKLPLEELIAAANKVRKTYIGQELDLCSIINAKSGACNQDCKFCAQSAYHHTKVQVHPLKTNQEIVDAAKEAKKIGAGKFGIVTSGNNLTQEELLVVAKSIKIITEDIGLTVCGSLGALTKDQMQILKDAGLKRYHHNIETSPNYYPKIVSTHNFRQRLDTIKAAKAIGLQVCSGGIIGMGESWQDRIDMALLLKELNVDSVPLNILVPIAGTKLEGVDPISVDDVLRTISIFRVILKDKTIKIAAGRETALRDSQALGFKAGANGMLIGGYLTVKGRSVEEDQNLAQEIKKIWNS